MNLVELALDVHRSLDAAALPHAFGGALALAFVADPRGTADLDVNVFVPVEQAGQVVDALSMIELTPESAPSDWMPAAGLRFRSAGHPFPVDVFLSLDPTYDQVAARVDDQILGPAGSTVPVLSAEDLAVFKLSFGRPKDWVDLAQILSRTPLDLEYIDRQLLALRGPAMHPRLARLRAMAREAPS